MFGLLRPNRFRAHPRGQGLAEYVLILALVAMIAITAILFLGGGIAQILSVTGRG